MRTCREPLSSLAFFTIRIVPPFLRTLSWYSFARHRTVRFYPVLLFSSLPYFSPLNPGRAPLMPTHTPYTYPLTYPFGPELTVSVGQGCFKLRDDRESAAQFCTGDAADSRGHWRAVALQIWMFHGQAASQLIVWCLFNPVMVKITVFECWDLTIPGWRI